MRPKAMLTAMALMAMASVALVAIFLIIWTSPGAGLQNLAAARILGTDVKPVQGLKHGT
jgi:hypothetical protein